MHRDLNSFILAGYILAGNILAGNILAGNISAGKFRVTKLGHFSPIRLLFVGSLRK